VEEEPGPRKHHDSQNFKKDAELNPCHSNKETEDNGHHKKRTHCEAVLVAFTNTLELVKDPNAFTLGTGTSIHSTGSSQGLRAPNTSSAVGNGAVAKVKGAGKLGITVCNKRGNELFPTTVKEARVMQSPFNLLSGSGLLAQGCKAVIGK
jgi:hypothetical protein